MTRRQKRKQAQDILGLAIIVGMVFIVGAFTIYFPKIDCYNARKGLGFIERCEADQDCNLTAKERNLKQAYTRLEIKSCYKD